MAARRTLEFLPTIFQTDTNRKFLSATLDQLVSEPEYTRLNGYIGRTFAPTYKSTDSYVPELNGPRQNYQLEPSLVIKNSDNNVEFYSNYTDIVNKLSYYGAITDNHDRLFSSEIYAYNNLIDQDKFVNFSQYYWLPNGPRPVLIKSQYVVSQATYVFNKDNNDDCYRVDDQQGNNPEIVLARGGKYRFKVAQPGSRFWIQTEPGIDGVKHSMPNVSSREIYGISNNGTDDGFIEFKVPLVDTQDVYLKMPMQSPVDYAISTAFARVDGVLWDDLVATDGGLDGMDINPDSKTLVFLNSSSAAADWTRADGSLVDPAHRRGVWRIRLTKDAFNRDVVNLDYLRDVRVNNRIYSRLGRSNANKEFYKNNQNQYIPVPALTAQLDVLYYQDSSNPNMSGRIRLVNTATDNIYVDTAILGKKNYTSPDGIDFTNGLVVKFDGNAEPARYANGTYIVEGVGRGIRLVNFDWLKFPEPGLRVDSVPVDTENWDIDNYDEPFKGPSDPQYITMNRGTLDLNAWARHNRWFHVSVLTKSAEINGTTSMFKQAIRATRPIIEFEPDIQLINNGRIGKRPVDHISTSTTDAFNQIQHSQNLILDGATLNPGQRVLFPNDKDPLVRQQVYKIQYKIQDEPAYRSIFDGTGSGVITIDSIKFPYFSAAEPVLDSFDTNSYNYSWKVRGRRELLTATRIEGLDFPNNATGLITSVNDLTNGLYEIFFSVNVTVADFVIDQIAIVGTNGTPSIIGVGTKFKTELKIGSAIYSSSGTLLGIVDGIQTDTIASLVTNSTEAVFGDQFTYKHPRIQLLISDDPDDALEDYDCLVATNGANKGRTFWYDGNRWHQAQQKSQSIQTPLFDVFDKNSASFSSYDTSQFVGTKIFSYRVGAGAADRVLGFPIAYTTNSIIADITFNDDFATDVFKYRSGGVFVTKKINSGYLRQNTGRYTSTKRNTWTRVVEPSKQYQIISKTYTGRTNHVEIDILPKESDKFPNLKVFQNSKLLLPSQYLLTKVGKKDTVKISSKILTAGDRIDVLIYSDSVSQLGFYQVPLNLDYNSKNQQFSTLTLGQMRTNLNQLGQNLIDLVGDIPGESNLRDIDSRYHNGNIIQNSAPIIYTGLFLIHEQANFVNSVDYARREYTKFKNKFLELAGSLSGLNPDNPQAGVDKILASINQVKGKSFPWYYSDMVPYGTADVIKYQVLNSAQRQYKINSIFDDTVLQSRAVLVYHNNHLLIKDKDYTFDKTRPGITLADHVDTATNDIIEIRDYASTDGNFIPETPTKLGLYPKFVPALELDDTYRNPIQVIQGHDGSRTPAFGDYRDLYLLELEKRIYNNIKINAATPLLDIRSFVPGRFRDSQYTLTEFNRILNRNFMRWAGANKIDYITNNYFVGNDQFSYNYRQSKDSLFGENLPGYWRGIYQYYYDTDRPHTHPWEMLGFTEKPHWWESEYGPAPYTQDNTVLWDDLEKGIIKQGPNAGEHSVYARPELKKIIPVDSSGELLPPLARIATQFNNIYASSSWQVGDVAPVEAAWKRTSEYPFALQATVAMMKPGIYFGSFINTNRYYKDLDLDQYVDADTGQRINPLTIDINGELHESAVTRSSGYLNWISDYLTSLGISGPTKLRSLLNNIDVQLSYKLAGFSDKKYLTILAEQYSPTSTNESVIIPDDSYGIQLNKSVPIERVSYSAVIIERTPTGFAVSGYNTNNPFFTVVPSETAGDRYSIEVGGVSAVIYKDYKKQKLLVPYGTEFKTRQQVVDFLVSYQRYLFAQGFVFDEYNETLSKTQDWILSAEEFISWALQGWGTGNSIVLSPVNTTIKLLTDNSVVDYISNDSYGSRLLDPNFSVIKTTEITTLRDSNIFKVSCLSNKTISFAELNLVQYEHVLLFDNTTIFNDVIYKPESGSRQYRLKLVGNKTSNWDGSLSPQGFVYNSNSVDQWRSGKDYKKGDLVSYKNQYYVAIQNIDAAVKFDVTVWKQIEKSQIKTGMLPNFATNAGRFIDVYDPDTSLLDKQWTSISNGLIGFRPRNYLTELNVNLTSQAKFYQGYIKEKGTAKAVTNLLNATFNNLKNDISFYEQWAMRVGEYGALDTNRFVEIELDEAASKNNPAGIAVIGDHEAAIDGVINVRNKELYNRPFDNAPVEFINRSIGAVFENDIQSAGYVNIDDVDATIFDGSNYQYISNNLNDISSGYIIWVAKDLNRDWNVYRATETEILIDSIAYGLDSVGLVTTTNIHNFKVNQTVVIKNINRNIDGFYTVASVTGLHQFTIRLNQSQSDLLRIGSVSGPGIIFSLQSVRFDNPSSVANFTPRHGWKDGDRVWVDRNKNDRWAVYEKNSVWDFNSSLDIKLGAFKPFIHYGASVKVDRSGNFVVVGAPGDQNGLGRIHVFDKKLNKERGVLGSGLDSIQGLGKSVDMADVYIAAGAPESYTTKGAVVVYKYAQETFFLPVQILQNPDNQSLSEFGHSLTMSKDANWLYVGAPGSNKVYYYRLKKYETRVDRYDAAEARRGCVVPYPVTDPQSLAVYLNGRLLVLGTDYIFNPARNRVEIILDIPIALETESGLGFALETGPGNLRSELSYLPGGTLAIMQRSYYEYQGQVGIGSGIDEFGYSLKTSSNGKLLIVGAPGANDGTIVRAGLAYVFNNSQTSDPDLVLQESLKSSNPVYRAKFGSSVDICANNCSLYVGSPGYSDLEYAGGLVHRFVNSGKLFGFRQGIKTNPTVTIGHSIYINGVEVVFTGTSLNSVIANINDARIVGVRASRVDNTLYLSSEIEVEFDRLNILLGVGTALTDLGLSLFDRAQTIRKPIDTEGENFGSQVKISDDAETLAVSSTRGTAQTYSIVDNKTTTFDGQATQFLDITQGTGAVYFHDFLENSLTDLENKFGNFVFSSEFNAPNLKLGDLFGCSVDFDQSSLFIGASYNDYKNHNAGAVYSYSNPQSKRGWNIVREQQPAVDVSSINNVSLYNKITRSKIAALDYIDPIKGKCLGIVEENLNYKSSKDPAMYNAGTSVANTNLVDFHWGAQQVGKTWWNLDTARFIDYEQDTIVYRLNNWGSLFPQSDVAVYEWVESNVLPSAWQTVAEQGIPLHADDSAYVQINYADKATGIVKTKYYFWVRGLTKVSSSIPRSMSIQALENAIRNPKSQNLPYAAILSSNSLALFNCDKYISGTNVILKVDYDKKLNTSLIHNEFEIVGENDKGSTIPRRIIDKLVDSLSGIDKTDRGVPDAKLKSGQKIGLEIRPRQTLILDKFAALKNLVQFVNEVFAGTTAAYKLQNSRKFSNAYFFTADQEPLTYTHRVENTEELGYVNKTPGDLILVASDENYFGLWTLYQVMEDQSLVLYNNQSYKTQDIWEYQTWYAKDFDPLTEPDYVVNYAKDLQKLDLQAGHVVRINNTATGGFEIYRYTSNSQSDLVAVENGTLRLKDLIWDTEINSVGFDNQGIDESPFDRDYSKEIRNMLIGLEKDIFIDDLIENFNRLYFTVIHYILSEQQNVDWIFKTSFISVLHNIKELKNYPSFVKDNHSYYVDYINEVKPYRTKIKDYKVGYTGLDRAGIAVTDFDLPGYWDKDLERFRSPSLEIPAKDGTLLALPEYSDWAKNYTSGIESISIADPGFGFTQAPQIQIIANNDNGAGATAEAAINEITGAITQIYVTNPGRGYKNTPYVVINGDGAGARAYARLINQKIRSIKTVMKFDRLSYNTEVVEWQPNVSYTAGQTVSYQGNGYQAKVNNQSPQFNRGNFRLLKGDEYLSASDRVAATYQPGPNQIPKEVGDNGEIDLARLIPGVTYELNTVISNRQVYNESRVPSPKMTELTDAPEDINIAGGAFFDRTKSHAPEELIPGRTFDSVNIKVDTELDDGSVCTFRILKNYSGQTEYLVVSNNRTTTLAQDFAYTDDRIYLTDITAVSAPNVQLKQPGVIYINGERIKFWEINESEGYIKNPIRGIDYTAESPLHLAGSIVQDQGPGLVIPGTTEVKTARYTFNKRKPVFAPSFVARTTDFENAKNNLKVYLGATLLDYEKDYNFTLVPADGGSKLEITFVDAANFADGLKFSVRYTEDLVWLNPGSSTIVDGTGLSGSSTAAAQFVKSFRHF